MIIKKQTPMRTPLPFFHRSIGAIALMTTLPALAQSPCDDLTVFPPRYDAFNPERIAVWVNNQSNEIFSYPNFVLLNAQGDVLASEEVATFGIGGPDARFMQVTPGITLPTGPFDATLQLFGNFGDTLFCSWSFPGLTLCPPEACVPAEIRLTNTGELVAFEAFWWVTNTADGTPVASGNFAMNEEDATGLDTVCLPPGEYLLGFSPFSPIDESYIIGITPNAQFTPGTDVAQQQDTTPLDLAFDWYTNCAESSNGIAQQAMEPPSMVMDNGILRITAPQSRALGTITLWSSDGRLVTTRATNAATAEIPLHDLATGIILVHTVDPAGNLFTQRIFTH